MIQREELREGRRVTVVEREPHELTPEERRDAALAELQEELRRLRPGWQPKHPIRQVPKQQ